MQVHCFLLVLLLLLLSLFSFCFSWGRGGGGSSVYFLSVVSLISNTTYIQMTALISRWDE